MKPGRSLLVCLLASAGCGGEGGAASPAPVPTTATGSDASVEAATPDDAAMVPEASAEASAPARRTVTWRDPFGNYAVTDNLLVDGDFEWASPFAMQYPWFRYPVASAITLPDLAVGMACHSGTKCVRLRGSAGLAGFATRPPGGADHADLSLWVKPLSAASCSSVAVSVSGCLLAVGSSALDTSLATPDPDGWCQIAGTVQMPDDTPCIFISLNGTLLSQVLVDDVVMTRPAATSSQRSCRSPSDAHLRMVDRLRQVIRTHLGPGAAKGLSFPSNLRGKAR